VVLCFGEGVRTFLSFVKYSFWEEGAKREFYRVDADKVQMVLRGDACTRGGYS